MISAATGTTALAVAPLVASHGVGHLIAATIKAGAVAGDVVATIPIAVLVAVTVFAAAGRASVQMLAERGLKAPSWRRSPVSAASTRVGSGLK